MKKIFYGLFILAVIIFTLFILSGITNAAKVSVDKLKGLKVVDTTTNTIKLKWSKVKNVTGYKVYIYNSNTDKYEYYGKTKNNSIEITKLKSSKKYKIKARAYKTKNKKNYYGKYSNILTCATKPTKTNNVKSEARSDSTISLVWDSVTRATGYKVYIFNTKENKYEYYGCSETNKLKITGLKSATTYKIRVRAYRTAGGTKYYGEYSKAVTLGTNPSKINNIFVKENNVGSITLQWDKVARAKGYRVYIYDNNKNGWVCYKEITENYITIPKENLNTNKFRVRAFITVGDEKYFGKYSAIIPIRKGIDVSGYQKEIDWQKVRKSGIEFAIIRCGGRYYGSSGTIYSDSTFERNMREAKKHGLDIGIYFFSAAITKSEAIEEADWCVEKLKSCGMQNDCKYIAYDFEVLGDGRAKDLSKKQLTNNAIAFMNRVLEKGYTPILYGNMTYLNKYFDLGKIKQSVSDYKIWLAHFVSPGQDTTYQGSYDIWQYTSTGRVDGIDGDTDLDIVYF